jgi:ubiquinol-cytochrome c reductase cytochrome b subunit
MSATGRLTDDAVRFVDERTSATPLLRRALRYPFPDHWSFLLGEVALYAFVVLVATGVYLTLFFEPSVATTVYRGGYGPLQGLPMSRAYASVVDLSLDQRAGLLIRQTHHWAADVFVAAIVLHVMRVFFTGAFRRPRELTWLLGLGMLMTALLEGFLGYSLVDDLLSGMGLAIGYSVAMSIPLVGANLALGIWGAPFPGDPAFMSRMFIGHVLLLPVLIGGLLGGHLALVAAKHHTQFRRGAPPDGAHGCGRAHVPGAGAALAGPVPARRRDPVRAGGLVQINPIWQWGPYEVAQGTNGAQPDWYLGWLIGALRLVPGFDLTVGDETLVPNPFWGGALFPLIVFGALAVWPWAERRLTGDRAPHNLLDRPRDAPLRTAIGAAFFTWVFLIFAAGSADRVYVSVGLPYVTQLWAYRVGIWVLPAIVFVVARRWCVALQRAERVDREQELGAAQGRERQRAASAG